MKRSHNLIVFYFLQKSLIVSQKLCVKYKPKNCLKVMCLVRAKYVRGICCVKSDFLHNLANKLSTKFKTQAKSALFLPTQNSFHRFAPFFYNLFCCLCTQSFSEKTFCWALSHSRYCFIYRH